MKKVLIGLGLASLVTVSSYAQNDFYLKGGVGISKTQTLDNEHMFNNKLDESPYDSETFENYSLGLGYKINNYYNLELMLQYTPSFDLSGSNYKTNGVKNDYEYFAEVNYSSLMINNIFSINKLLNKNWNLKPYLGLGFGFVKYEYEKYYITNYTNSEGNLSSNSGTNFTWKAILGTTYPLTDKIDFDLSYAYADYGVFESGTKDSGNIGDLQTPIEMDMKAHEVLFALRYNF